MADAVVPVPIAPVPPPTIHEAERVAGPSGAVLRGAEIDLAAAIARRRGGLDVVVCGADLKANRTLAASLESAVGRCQRGVPHTRHAGPLALPHFQQATPPPIGHTFYETEHRKAKKKP
ncbi:MAG TPA: hypothetical protein VMG10_11005 [Gemmataceae bacterium]|nr:hypothetical protein [Gemmataceae bacterium]